LFKQYKLRLGSRRAWSSSVSAPQQVARGIAESIKKAQGLYRTLGEQLKKLSSFSSGNLQNNLLVLHPQLHQVVVKHKVLNVSKNKYAMQ
jgi:hypothetical protein